MIVPVQLRREEFRFCLIEKKGKRPFEKAWQDTTNYKWDDPKLQDHITKGGNYGAIGGFGNLLVIDFDNQKLQDKVIDKLPETMVVQSGGGLKHCYFEVDNPESFKLLDDKKETLADIQAKGKQVVTVGSVHPNGNTYKVIKDKPIAKTTLAEIKALFADYLPKETPTRVEPKRKDTKTVDEIRSKLKVPDLLRDYGIDISKNPTGCPFHSSKGGKCLSFKDEIWNCFHCGKKGDIFHLHMEKEGTTFIKTLQMLAEKVGIKINNSKDMVDVKNMTEEKISEAVKMHIMMKDTTTATELITQYLLQNHHIYTTRDDNCPEMWIYNEGIYIPQGHTFVKEISRNICGKAYTTYFGNQVIAKIEADTFIDQDEFFRTGDIQKVPVQNGILDILELKLYPFTPTEIYFNKMPVKYDSKNKCPNIIKHLDTVLKDKEDIPVMQEMFGFCLLKEYKYEKAFMLIGDGRNGKSKTLDLIKRFIGPENCSSVPLQKFEEDNFASSELFGKMVNVCGDLSSTALKQTGNFKTMTGQDLISAQRKFKTHIHFVNHAKFIFATNELPRTYDKSFAFFNRWIIFDFPYKFYLEHEFNVLSDEEKINAKKANPEHIKSLSSEEELSGLLNWALEGLHRLNKNKCFSYSKTTKAVEEAWMRKSDSASAFLMDCVEEEWGNRILKGDMHQAYGLYCKKHKIKMVTDKSFKDTITMTFGCYEGYIDKERCWDGVKFKPSETKDEIKKFYDDGIESCNYEEVVK